MLGRLLEEGTRGELRWLVATLGEDRLTAWLRSHGGRQLSRRSRALWQLVLGVEAAEPSAVAREIWPLA